MVFEGGYGFSYAAAREFHQGLKANWRHLRAVFVLDGLDPRSWSAADRAAVAYLLLKRQYRDDPTALRELLLLADDKAAVADLDRQIMGQAKTIVTDR